jgi:hypothetical protein
MNAPGGGEYRGVAVHCGRSLHEENSFKEKNSCVTAIGAESGREGATAVAGNGVLAVQQFAPAEL